MKVSTKESLRARGIFNVYGIAELGDLFGVDESHGGQRERYKSGWQVFKIGHKYEGPWYDHGSKVFLHWNHRDIFKDRHAEAMQRALEFASSESGQDEWWSTPFGGWVSAATGEKAGLVPRRKWSIPK